MAPRPAAEYASRSKIPSGEAKRHSAGSDEGLEQVLSHSPREWASIRPRFEYLYVDLDMTLRDVMAKLETEHGFYAR